jgi:GNAT superfamily N-acetyltransferase
VNHLLSVAENANTHQPLGPNHERIENERFVLWMGSGTHPSWNVVQRLRLEPNGIDATIEEVHAILSERSRDACSWEIGHSATPRDLVERLYERGLVDDDDPDVIGMLLTAPPPPAPDGIEVRQVRTFEEFAAAKRIAAQAFGMPEEEFDAERERERWDDAAALAYWKTFVAVLDGEIVASANSTYLDGAVTLNGGAVLTDARGRGAYRALVSARWDDAVARGTPALVTQAGRMSAPILERLGFREVARIKILVDRFGS